MANVYTVRLAYRSLSAAGDQVIYTAPNGLSIIIRDIVATNAHTAAQLLNVYIAISGGGVADLVRSTGVATGGMIHQDVRQVILPGETLHFLTDLGPGRVLVTGYQF